LFKKAIYMPTLLVISPWSSFSTLTTPRISPQLSISMYKYNNTISDYVDALREIVFHCKFSPRKLLEKMLRDRLVSGVNHQGIQRNLLF